MSTKSQPLSVVKNPHRNSAPSSEESKKSVATCAMRSKNSVEIVETNSLILLLIAIKAVRKVVTSNHDDGTK
jgi:hypothetical protein